MPRCSYHPDVETGLTCVQCGKPICPKEMVATPVGYKCPEDARMAPGQYRFVKPRQLALAFLFAAGAGVLGGVVIGFVRFGVIILGALWGAGVAEAARRGSGGHRGLEVAVAAVMGIAVGWLLVNFAPGLRVPTLTAIVAAVVALFQLGVIGKR